LQGLQYLKHFCNTLPGAIKIKAFPTECFQADITASTTNPAAIRAFQDSLSPLLNLIANGDIIRRTMITPSFPGDMLFAVSSSLPVLPTGTANALDTASHMQMSQAVNFNLDSSGDDPEWIAHLPSDLHRLITSGKGMHLAFGLPHDHSHLPAVEVAARSFLPYHRIRQPPGHAVLVPVGAVHSVSHPCNGYSLKIARDFQLVQGLGAYLQRDSARAKLTHALLAGMDVPFLSRSNPRFSYPYMDNSLSKCVVVGATLHAAMTTKLL
jgi:hypothetical protein